MKHSHIWIQVSKTRQACTLCNQQRKGKKLTEESRVQWEIDNLL